MTWQELDPKAQRKALIFAALVGLALLVLIWPTGVSLWRSPARPQPRQRPMGNAGPVVRAAPPHPAPDPLTKLLGKWEGRVSLADRGVCHLSLELGPGSDRQGFQAFSTFACPGNLLSGGDQARKDPAGLETMMSRAINTTSASFSGKAEDGGIVLHALDNVGVSEAFEGCDMVSMTLKTFGENRMSVRWQETGKGVCTGGEMLLAHAR
jgi:hypothetical protein